jgi:hypothetical protein
VFTVRYEKILHKGSRIIFDFKTCCSYHKDKRETFGNLTKEQISFGNRETLDRKVLSLSL